MVKRTSRICLETCQAERLANIVSRDSWSALSAHALSAACYGSCALAHGTLDREGGSAILETKLRVTESPQESSFADLVSGDSVLTIPLFQRPYRWAQRHLNLLIEDIDKIRDEMTDSVFLGVLVSYSRGITPGRPVAWEVVDGQQRVTTLYLLVMAIVEVAARNEEGEWADDVAGTYLLVRPLASNPVNTKLVPSYGDRAQFAAIWKRLQDVPSLKSGRLFSYNPPMPPPPSGLADGEMTKQYSRIRRLVVDRFKDGGRSALEEYLKLVVQHLSFVSISLRDPSVAPKIFERLNARAEPITVADLVRNEIFSRAGDDVTQAQHVFSTYWEPFIAHFSAKNIDFSKFLFPYGLIHNPNVRKVELFTELRNAWKGYDSPQEIIADLDRHRPTFLALECDVRDENLPSGISLWLSRINGVGRPSSTYSFIMRLIDSFRKQEASEANVVSVLQAVESFLFRRAVMGIEPTGLHAAFKGLWQDLAKQLGSTKIDGPSVKAALAAKPTIHWPSDSDFMRAVETESIYGKKISAYAIIQREMTLKGETPGDSFHIEHIAPQALTDSWQKLFPEEADRALIDTWGNLVALSEEMNPSVGQKLFAVKRAAFADSKFAGAREASASESEWTPDVIRKRNAAIAKWAITRWSY